MSVDMPSADCSRNFRSSRRAAGPGIPRFLAFDRILCASGWCVAITRCEIPRRKPESYVVARRSPAIQH